MSEYHLPHALPPLPFATDALEPHYDKATLEIHHGKHHAAYVDKLNQALMGFDGVGDLPDLQSRTVEELLCDLHEVPMAIRKKVIQNGGGHANHSLFWKTLAPASHGGGGQPTGDLGQAIQAEYGAFEVFQQKFTDAAMEHFGSGWTFLVQASDGRLSIQNLPNQDSPLSDRQKPLLLVDLWEHAYYLKWTNRKAEWIESWWKLVNWPEVEKNFAEEPAWSVARAEIG